MKANRIPQSDRLKAHIAKLEIRLDTCWSSKRYYPQCRQCGITNVQLSIDGDHRRGCPLRGVRKEIAHYESLLNQALGVGSSGENLA